MGILASISQHLVNKIAETIGCESKDVYQAMAIYLETQDAKEAKDLGIPIFQDWKHSLPLTEENDDMDLAEAYHVIKQKAKLKKLKRDNPHWVCVQEGEESYFFTHTAANKKKAKNRKQSKNRAG